MIIETEILEVRQTTPIDRTLRLAIPADAREGFAFTPGQFVVLHDLDEEKPTRRAYSISSPPSDAAHLEITVRDMGTYGAALYRHPVGTRLGMRSPAGRFVLQENPDEALLMVAGGSGVTPFHAFVGDLAARGSSTPATLLQSAQQAAELVFHGAFEAWADSHAPFTYVPTITRAASDDPWQGRRGRIERDLVAAHIPDPDATRFYACGPGAFVKAMLALAEALGIPKERRHKEQWG